MTFDTQLKTVNQLEFRVVRTCKLSQQGLLNITLRTP